MTSRRIKLVSYEHQFACPHCRTAHLFQSTTPTFSGERMCLKCDKNFLIEDGKAKKLRVRKRAA